MNFGNQFDNRMNNSMRSPGSARQSQSLTLRGQQSPMPQDQYDRRNVNSSGGNTNGHTPNSRYNTPSKSLPKSSYLQRRTPGTTPSKHDPNTPRGGTPYNLNSSSRMSTGFKASPGTGLTTPGRRGGGRMSIMSYDSTRPEQNTYQHDYSRMDETLNGGELFSGDTDNVHESHDPTQTGNGHAQFTPSGNYMDNGGLRQRRGLGTPSRHATSSRSSAVMDPHSVTKSMHPHWVIVFGLPAHANDDSPCSTMNVLKLFQGYGEIDNYHTSPGNWLLIKFSSSLDANNAAGVLHRTFLTSEVMIGVESLTPELAKKLNLTIQVDGQLIISPEKKSIKHLNRAERQGRVHGALLDPDYDNILRPPRKVTKDICTRIFEFFMY